MAVFDPALLGLRAATREVAAGTVSVAEVAAATLERMGRAQAELNAFLATNHRAVTDARRVDAALARRSAGRSAHTSLPLAGAMISVKDLVLTRAWPTTAGSRTFGAGITTQRDAPVVTRLKRAGAVIIGKTNLHEIAMGVTNVNEHFGPVRNPWDRSRVPGGSSGGSGAAVAASLGSGSVGTDTRGSIRIPASCCGITGLKPTRGLVPVASVVPLSFTLDTVGPMTRSVEDTAVMLGVMAGSARLAARWIRAVDDAPPRVRLGLCGYYFERIDPPVERAVRAALAVLERLVGVANIVENPALAGAHPASAVITGAEALAYHQGRLRDNPDGFGPIVRQRLEGGARFSAVDYVRAELARRAVESDFDRLFRDVDVIVAPTLAALPHLISEQTVLIAGEEAPNLDAFTRLNSPQNMAGLPALSLPCGFADGLPIGVQLIAARGREDLLLSLGAAYQRETDWHLRRPLEPDER